MKHPAASSGVSRAPRAKARAASGGECTQWSDSRTFSQPEGGSMSKLVFTQASKEIVLLSHDGTNLTGPFDAANNVDSRSKGPWPAGTFKFIGAIAHSELTDPESAYGEFGILIFDVPGRSGMGVHSGRRDIADGL